MKAETAIETAFEDHKQLDPVEPEKNLMRAILKSAMEDMDRSGDSFREAKTFFLLEEEKYIYSFKSICHHLDLCEKTIREIVGLSETALKQQQAQNNNSEETSP